VYAGHGGLQGKDACGARGRVRNTRQLKHGLDVGLVLFAQLGHLRRAGEIVVAVGHAEAALQ
jgi:hypothetical protein